MSTVKTAMNLPNRLNAIEKASELSVENFDLGSLLGYRLVKLSSAIGALAEQEAQEVAGLTLPEYRVLVVLHLTGAMGVNALQRTIGIDKAWISRTLAKLATKALVVSALHNQDGRRSEFRLTARGKHAAEALIERAINRQAKIFEGFAPEEVASLMGYLGRIQANVETKENETL